MSFRYLVFSLVFGCVVFVSALAAQEGRDEGATLYAKGESLLKQGDFNGALKAYTEASSADPTNAAYARQAMLVRRIEMLRHYVGAAEVSPKWEKTVLSLHAFYMANQIRRENIALTRMAHEKLNNALSASLLANSLLDAGMNKEALELLEGLEEEKLDRQNSLYLGIALARTGRTEEAAKVRDECTITEESKLSFLCDGARLSALLGDTQYAKSLLKRCFEMTPPSQLDSVKAMVAACQDFKPLMKSDDFNAVMSTASKVQESGCSSGSDCGSCPSRSKCGSATGSEGCSDQSSSCSDKKSSDCSGCGKQ